ncbi:MAG TPA: hypothetical protein VNS19_14740 [Acidimicrobiales bacterium]|nr:hypothetical protein [Acidimicrobiales bacterium]
MPARSWVRPPGRPIEGARQTHPGFHEARWVTASGHVGRLLLGDQAATEVGGLGVWSLALGSGTRIDVADVVSASPLARAWIDGFLAGQDLGPLAGEATGAAGSPT